MWMDVTLTESEYGTQISRCNRSPRVLLTKLHGLSLRENWATAACRRSDCQLFADRGCHVVSATDPYSHILGLVAGPRWAPDTRRTGRLIVGRNVTLTCCHIHIMLNATSEQLALLFQMWELAIINSGFLCFACSFKQTLEPHITISSNCFCSYPYQFISPCHLPNE
jgi:hypothetical protein